MTIPIPQWLKDLAGRNKAALRTSAALSAQASIDKHVLHTVCHAAHCPNRGECFNCGDATFMVLADNTVAYKGVVSYNSQWQQLAINGLAGKSNVTVKVKLAEPTPNVQMCVDYEDNSSEWPSFNGSDEITFTTKEGAVIKTMGIQYTDPDKNPAQVSVLGAWLVTTTTGISNIESVKLQDGKAFNLAGQQVGKGYKGVVIKNGKKMVIK